MADRNEDLVRGVLGALVATTLSDGEVQPEERIVLRAVLEQYEIPEGELTLAYEAFRREGPRLGSDALPEERMSLMRHALLAAQADGTIAAGESRFLEGLAARLGLTDGQRQELEEFSRTLFRITRRGRIDRKKIDGILKRYIG